MAGVNLAVDQPIAPLQQFTHREGKSRLRGIACPVKHGFAKKHPTETQAIQSSNQVAFLPCFERMGQTQLVQLTVSPLDLRGNPSGLGVGAGFCTGIHDLLETQVVSVVKLTGLQCLA